MAFNDNLYLSTVKLSASMREDEFIILDIFICGVVRSLVVERKMIECTFLNFNNKNEAIERLRKVEKFIKILKTKIIK